MKNLRLSLSTLTFTLLIAVPMSALAQDQPRIKPVDFYISLFGGGNSPLKTNITETGPGVNVTGMDAKLDGSASIGGKIGMWATGPRAKTGVDFGAELDITNFNPDLKGGQVLSASGTVGGAPVVGIVTSPVELNSTIVAVNLLVRLPIGVTDELQNGRFFPYAGIGGGFETTSFCPAQCVEKATDTALAFQALAGFKVFLFRHVALFGEYKFTHASHTFETQSLPTGAIITDELDLNVNHFVGGLSFHF